MIITHTHTHTSLCSIWLYVLCFTRLKMISVYMHIFSWDSRKSCDFIILWMFLKTCTHADYQAVTGTWRRSSDVHYHLCCNTAGSCIAIPTYKELNLIHAAQTSNLYMLQHHETQGGGPVKPVWLYLCVSSILEDYAKWSAQ